MTSFSRRSLFGSLFLALFLSVSCSSKKPKNSADADSSGSISGSSLELNGSSDSGTAGGLNTVYFAFDSSTLDSSAKQTLKDNAEFLKNNSTVSVQIEGHCDERGGIQYNLALGEKRAKSVKEYLVALGVSSQKISTVSFGKEKPVAFGHDESAWGKNRRGTFVITAK